MNLVSFSRTIACSLLVLLLPLVTVAQLFTVTSSLDESPGSLRDIIAKANSSKTGGVIQFKLHIGEERVIVLKSHLPAVTAPNIIIDGALGDGKVITLDGRNLLVSPVLTFEGKGSGFKNLDFINFIDPLSFADIDEGVFVRVYPNPVSEELLSVEIDQLTEARIPILIELQDLNGKSIASKYTENSGQRLKTNIDIGRSIPPGKYIIAVRIKERQYRDELIME